MEEFITPKQAAQQLGMSVPGVYKAIRDGNLTATRVLGHVALRPADVAAYQPARYGSRLSGSVKRRGPGRSKSVDRNDSSPKREGVAVHG